MRTFLAVIERCPSTGLLVGYVPGFPGPHRRGANVDELQVNLQEVIEMLLEDGEPQLETDFIGLQQISVARAPRKIQKNAQRPARPDIRHIVNLAC